MYQTIRRRSRLILSDSYMISDKLNAFRPIVVRFPLSIGHPHRVDIQSCPISTKYRTSSSSACPHQLETPKFSPRAIRTNDKKRSHPGSGIAPFFSYWIRLTESRMISSGSNILLPVTSCCTASIIHSAAASPNSSLGWERVVSLTLPAVLKNESSLPTTE